MRGRGGHQRLAIAIVASAAAMAAASCGDESEPAPTTNVNVPPAATTSTTPGSPPPQAGAGTGDPPRADEPTTPAEGPSGDPRQTALERSAERTVRRFVAALDARDGAAACALLVDAIEQIDLPRNPGGCAASLEASIGYRDPRGLPVWESANVAKIVSLRLDGEQATVVATIVTKFADRDEVSIEDDVIYLVREGEAWTIAKPSATLYRAVGIADVPPSVLAPP